jgi:hypothetical protein
MTAGVLLRAHVGNQRLPVPENFCLETNRDEMLSFLWSFRRRMSLPIRGRVLADNYGSRIPKIGTYYDFAAIKKITPAAALVFASEFDRIRRVYNRTLYAIDIDKWNPEVIGTLRDIGFFSLLGIEDSPPTAQPNNPIVLRFRSNTKVVSEEIGGEGSSLLGDLFATIQGDQALRLSLYTAILEAMQNVIDHAYVETFFYKTRHVKSWWLSASADRVSRELTVILYDQGITIPVSLPYRQTLVLVGDTFRKLFGMDYDPNDPKYDAAALEAAVRLSATSTGKDYHGKGLNTMCDVVTACANGRIRIVSRCGLYEVQSGGKVTTEVLPVPLGGTLIEIRAAF